MSEEGFRDPGLSLNRIYTKTGDDGKTNLVNGRRVAKDDPKVEAYGTVDELNTLVGQATVSIEGLVGRHPNLARLGDLLRLVQHELFNLGSQLATDPDQIGAQQPRVGPDEIARLEAAIDEFNEGLPELPSFVLPGGSRLNAELHQCRAVCRRAERRVATLSNHEDAAAPRRYLNRLSDAFFVWSRWSSVEMGADEVLWQPNSGG